MKIRWTMPLLITVFAAPALAQGEAPSSTSEETGAEEAAPAGEEAAPVAEEAAPVAEEAAPVAEEAAPVAEEAAPTAEEAAPTAEELEAQRRAEEQVRLQAAEEAARAKARQAEEAAAPASEGGPAEAVGLDARVRRLSDAIARHIKRLPGDHRIESFTVMPFEQSGAEVESRQLGLVVSDLVLTNLARDHDLPLTERSQLGAILEEQSLGALGITAEEDAVNVGSVAGSRAIVLGQVADTGDAFKVLTRVIDVKSASVVGAEETELPKEELIAVSTDAVILRSKAGAFFRSLAAPGWGQTYNRQPVKAALVGGAAGGLAATTVLSAVATAGIYGAYLTASPSNDFWGPVFFDFDQKSTREAQEQRTGGLWLASNVALVATGGLFAATALAWGLGATEAYASGTDVDSLDEALLRQ